MLYSKKGRLFALPEGERMPQDNALEFIPAYNIIDARLRALHRGKAHPTFSVLVPRRTYRTPLLPRRLRHAAQCHRSYDDDRPHCGGTLR